MNLNKDYITIILEDKIYSQRTPTSKFIEFSLDETKQNSYENLPNEIKEIIDITKDMEQNPDYYFEYTDVEDGIRISKIKNVNIPYIKIPDTINGQPVKYLAYDATFGIKNIEQIQLPSTLEGLPQYGFKYLRELRYINMPEKIDTIPSNCFEGCINLRKIDLTNIKYFGKNSFYQCASLRELNLPNVCQIGENSFNDCVHIEKISLTGPITLIPNAAFYNCIRLKELELSDKISIISNYAFKNCGLESFTAPENLVSIGQNAFNNNNLKTINLNKKLQQIGDCAFTENDTKEVNLYSDTMYSTRSFSCKCINTLDLKKNEEISFR